VRHRWDRLGRCRSAIRCSRCSSRAILSAPPRAILCRASFPPAQFCDMLFAPHAQNRFGSCGVGWEEKRRQSRLANDFGCHTHGGHGDRDARIEIPPGCLGDDLKTMHRSHSFLHLSNILGSVMEGSYVVQIKGRRDLHYFHSCALDFSRLTLKIDCSELSAWVI